MTLEWIPLAALEAHPENSNRMPAHLLAKLKAHIRRTGLYEPLIVRPLESEVCESPVANCESNGAARDEHAGDLASAAPAANPTYQLLNGHHRAECLRQLGHTHARCDVWLVNDQDARLLLATLNRLEGRDDPAARGRLLANLAAGPSGDNGGMSREDLARLLPEPPDAIERLLALAQPPPEPLDPAAAEQPARPMTFFLSPEQHGLVTDALGEITRAAAEQRLPSRERELAGAAPRAEDSQTGEHTRELTLTARDKRLPRADALERLATWYLESRSLR
jgi:hypothetical protein